MSSSPRVRQPRHWEAMALPGDGASARSTTNSTVRGQAVFFEKAKYQAGPKRALGDGERLALHLQIVHIRSIGRRCGHRVRNIRRERRVRNELHKPNPARDRAWVATS